MSTKKGASNEKKPQDVDKLADEINKMKIGEEKEKEGQIKTERHVKEKASVEPMSCSFCKNIVTDVNERGCSGNEVSNIGLEHKELLTRHQTNEQLMLLEDTRALFTDPQCETGDCQADGRQIFCCIRSFVPLDLRLVCREHNGNDLRRSLQFGRETVAARKYELCVMEKRMMKSTEELEPLNPTYYDQGLHLLRPEEFHALMWNGQNERIYMYNREELEALGIVLHNEEEIRGVIASKRSSLARQEDTMRQCVFAICCLSCREILFVAESGDFRGYITDSLAEVEATVRKESQRKLPPLVHPHFQESHGETGMEKRAKLAFFPLHIGNDDEESTAIKMEFRDRFGCTVAKGACNLVV